MNTPTVRRDFLVQLGASAAFLGVACPLLGQSAAPAASSSPAKQSTPESEEVERLKRQLQSQREGSLRMMAAVHAKLGAPVCDAVGEYVAKRYEENYSKRKISGERNLEAVKTELWDKLPQTFGWEVVEKTPTTLKFKVTRCPLVDEMKKAGVAPELGYALNCASDPGIARGINPAIRFSRSQTIMQGQVSCDHCYELT